ncbi:sigma-70 family RNA polymerase sigma factor [Bradyrhizobium sp. WYCCWR 13023]|uniref:Sigma-70 family RNA polymerase sigma factor n=1 Tax=Bradyrhizobium zhengyangense TaxID=2911009 RepID=A0A9X1R675_9BRAD|nr:MULTISPECIES: sigma-70 family RNA polymerase sigma factor [Bradyrhizobium]MCG2626556.1 sigma-70 family RNA polymerase sigma factor [Bradyrhizobium zhengyangense]MCG2665671.1 sigma-70 family RNA polymerase sigma factor [Bradyrhizobium zhengyangense]
MSVIRERQRARVRTPSFHRPRRSAPLSGCAQTGSVASATRCNDPVLQSSDGPFDAKSRERLVYAVRQEADVSDEMLLKNVAEGDKAAMHIIFARHRKRVSQFIRCLVRNPAIVDDLVNQVFLDVWRSANMFEGRARVSTWLLSIARFKAINSRRERTHEKIDQDETLGIIDDGDTPDVALDRKETEGLLRACIDELSPAHREIIDLYYYRENSTAEVSEIIGIPQATVKSRIFYARKQLARILVAAGLDAAATR